MLNNAAALASSVLFSVPELLENIAEFSARGEITKKPYVTPMGYTRQVKSTTRDYINGVDEEGIAHNVLDESIPILGGKGLGDLYDIGFGIAESWLSGNTIGRAFGTGGKIIRDAAVGASAFARTATSVIDSVGQTGADGKQAMALGVTMGLLDAAGDILSTDDLMGLTSKTTVKEFMQKLLKHSAVEGLSETVTEGLGQAAEYHILGDYSTFARRRLGYLGRGNTPEQATRKALKDTMSDLGFTMLAASAAGALAGGAQTVLDEHLLGIKQADADIAANKYPEGELLTLKRDLDFASKSHTRFTPEGQERWAALEKRFNELLSKHKNTMAAREQRKFHEDAIRKTVQSGEYEEPFSPELYRLALEVTSPYGWDGVDRDAFGKGIAAGNKKSQQQKSADPEHSESGGEPVDNPVVKEYNENQIKSNYRLRFMSNRDQFFRNLNNVDPLDGYQDIACHADAYGFAAQDPETGELLEDLSPKELAYRIMDSGKYNGGPIRLLACSSGAVENGAAQQLADLLHVPVLAPMDTLYTSEDGYMTVASSRKEASRIMSQMSKNRIKSNMEGWKLYEPRER